MKIDVLIAEIGSTTTLVNAFDRIDGDDPVFWGQGQAATSAARGDVLPGLEEAVDDLCRAKGVGSLDYGLMLATSSAAGGLRMTVHGLVYDMTARAAKEAALGAGAIIRLVTAGLLSRADAQAVRDIRPNIIMLAGGVEHGERETALANARTIRALGLDVPVLYAGNGENHAALRGIFSGAPGALYIADNVYPRIDDLRVEPARKAIQAVFEEHIVRAPGMERIRERVSGGIIPTPGAVMESAKLLAAELGGVLAVDCGGATTDVHSVTKDSAAVAALLTAPEPEAKRTVEGDLGVYVNMDRLIDMIGERALEEELGFPIGPVRARYKVVPRTGEETRFVERLTREAVSRAVSRHAGNIRYLYGPAGRVTVAEGKDLSDVRVIVGTGGALSRLPRGAEILRGIAGSDKSGLSLLPPSSARVLIDRDYVMASLGVLAKERPRAALRLLKKSLGIEGNAG